MTHTNTTEIAMRVNGTFAGEGPQLAWLFGHYGVRTILIAGDEAAANEAQAILPGIKAVAVKKAKSQAEATCIPVVRAHWQIEEAAEKAIRELEQFKPFTVETPVTFEIHYVSEEMAALSAQFPGFKRSGPYSVSYTAANYLEGWQAYNTGRTISSMQMYRDLYNRVSDIPEVKQRFGRYVAERRAEWLEGKQSFPKIKR